MNILDFALSEPGLALISPMIGNYFRSKAEALKAEREFKLAAVRANTESHDAAAERTKDGGTWMRRALYGLIAFTFVSLAIAGFMEIPIILEQEVPKGFLFWRHMETVYDTVQGFLLPREIRQALIVFLGFYLGQGVK